MEKALEILKTFSRYYTGSFAIKINEAIKELEELENRSCWDCKYSEKTSGGVYCKCFSMHPDFEYCSDWKFKK